MEAAWCRPDPTVVNEGTEVMMKLNKIVTATERTLGGILETSKQFIKERLAEPFPVEKAKLVAEAVAGL